MRTKTLLLTAALGAVGLGSAMAQAVYSVNAVGFVNVKVPAGFSIIANPLKAASNKISDLLPAPPEGTTIYKFGAAGYTLNTFELGAWGDDAQTLVPGEGAFIRNPTATEFTITFVGEVSQGALSHSIPKGFSIQSSEVPQKGVLDTDLKFPVVQDDVVYRFKRPAADGGNPNGYSIHAYDLGDWSTPPTPDVGEGFFVKKAAATDWTRTFSVNTP